MLPSAAKWKRQPEVWLVSKIISQIDKEKKVSLLKKTPLFSFKASVVFFLSISSCLSQLGVSCQGHQVRGTLARGRGCSLEKKKTASCALLGLSSTVTSTCWVCVHVPRAARVRVPHTSCWRESKPHGGDRALSFPDVHREPGAEAAFAFANTHSREGEKQRFICES